jgi:hypothetical protein
MLCHVVWQKFTDISEVLAASIIRVITLMLKAASITDETSDKHYLFCVNMVYRSLIV